MAVNVVKLNNYLSGNVAAIEDLLNHLGCENIRYNREKREFRCSRDFGKNPSAVRVKVDNLRFSCFSTNEQGSIFNFVMSKLGISFPDSLKWVVNSLGLEKSLFQSAIKLPFDGFYKDVIRNVSEPELSQKTYSNEILNQYGRFGHVSFLKDGIDLLTQNKFSLGYDYESSRITIPQWNMNGELVGIMGRSNDPGIPYEYRWLPIIPCSRSYTLFGYHKNYFNIQQQQLAIITESEKGVMQMDSMGYHFGLATCTKNISEVQARYLKALMVDKIVIAYDEGISEEELRFQANKIKMNNSLYMNNVGYIYDKYNDILGNGSKASPTDGGVKNFKKLVNDYIRWI
ncbi:hypothetical protein AALA22_13060 [Anaerovoracaceae bacterium 41-7]